MKKCAALLTMIVLTGCGEPEKVYTAVDTLCTSTSRPPITQAMRNAFKADQGTFEPLVDWLLSFIMVRDGACLKPVPG